jgi:hypothetical protein
MVKFFTGCVVDSEWQAINIVQRLRSATFSSTEISLLFCSRTASPSSSSLEPTPAHPTRKETPSSGLSTNLLTNCITGAGVINVTGVGSFHAAGPVKQALNNWDGHETRTLSGRLQALGIAENLATRYADAVFQGEILILIHTEQLELANMAEQLFHRLGAKHICNSGRVSPSNPEPAGSWGFPP